MHLLVCAKICPSHHSSSSIRLALLPSELSALKYPITVAALWCPVIAIVSGNDGFCLPASVTSPARSECALKRPLMPPKRTALLDDVAHRRRHQRFAQMPALTDAPEQGALLDPVCLRREPGLHRQRGAAYQRRHVLGGADTENIQKLGMGRGSSAQRLGVRPPRRRTCTAMLGPPLGTLPQPQYAPLPSQIVFSIL